MASIALPLKSHNRAVFLRTTTSSYASSLLFSSSSSSSPPTPSTSSDQDDVVSNQNNATDNSRSDKPPSILSQFSDVKSSLKQSQQQYRLRPEGLSLTRGAVKGSPSNGSSYDDDIRKNLSEFRHRPAAAPPSTGQFPSQSHPRSQPISFEKLYMKNVANTSSGSGSNLGRNDEKRADAVLKSIRDIRLQLKKNSGATNAATESSTSSRLRHMDSFKLNPTVGVGDGGVLSRPTNDNLPFSVFGKEIEERKEREVMEGMKTELLRNYGYDELGQKLRKLRPQPETKKKQGVDGGGKNHISLLSELNDRLARLREVEKKNMSQPDVYTHLRQTFSSIDMKKGQTKPGLASLIQIGATPSFMLSPPKEQLVEKYFHPDNMSSAEKLKIELKRVRDEFKVHESDCGSTQVQIAKLTTEIHHLSKVLHKKDKHSRKGLQAKVQQRKNLLKYLRRTDWDSYCYILSKLGLRDNPGYKL